MSDAQKFQTQDMHDCILFTEKCHDICLQAIHECLQKGGVYSDAQHIGLLQDCVQICRSAHDFMLRHSHFHTALCVACAEICSACAESCKKIGDADCAAACCKCAELCIAMDDAPSLPRLKITPFQRASEL